jgi:hypothetical protein
LYECEIWYVTLREEHRFRVFEKKLLRRIFGPNREEVAGGWKKLHIEELCNLYASSNIINVITLRRMRWAGYVTCVGR